MKKFFALALLLPLVVVGCGKKDGKKTKKMKKNKHSMNMPVASTDGRSSFFDEEVGAFALADGDQGAVAVANNDQSVSWVEETDSKSFRPIYFEFDKAGISPDQESYLSEDVNQARKIVAKGDKLVVEGHACHSAGSKTYNLLISEHRAQEVANRLEAAGIDKDQITVVGRGTEMPVVLGGNKNEQAPNRRVELFPLAA